MSAQSSAATYRVTGYDRTGSRVSVRITAAGKAAAQDAALATGLAVERVEFEGVAPPAYPTARPQAHPPDGHGTNAAHGSQQVGPASVTPPPGATICQSCGGFQWRSTWPAPVWVLVVVTFPLGLLLLCFTRTHRCTGCGYAYRSRQTPASVGDSSNAALRVLAAVAAIAVLLAVVASLASMGNG